MIPKLTVLKLIEEMETVTAMDLVNYLDMTLNNARDRLKRLHKAGLIEPLGIERGRWVLSVKGYNKLDYLKRREDEQRGRKETGSSRS
ncbi:MAG: helix-turn-helix transcriptional regulator [Desulfobacteraceae bacterium]|nr:helix-turn-helix transcriptional regulator [Desulfobacteraceae bacterium]